MKRLVLFFLILIPSLYLLYFSLTRNPRDLPSVLIEKTAPDFELESLDGKRMSLHEPPGKGDSPKPVILNFWSTWCGPCIQEHQVIREAIDLYTSKGVIFYSILYEDKPENARQFVKQFGPAAPILLDPSLRTAIDYGVSGVPETFFIDRQGRIVYKQAGPLTPDILMREIERLLK
ncbi:MAG: redoxin domain-containing protein [Deltaproteobacteria bacterium]|nr:redoxin domain-containing protein [Deltaproteobacteria bacterium]